MSGKRILILEDDPPVAVFFASALRAAKHDVIVCNSFEDARTELRRAAPDALLTDVRVGQYNGLQLGILFRSLVPGGTILIVSGHDDGAMRQEAANIGAEFLVKPIDVAQLTSRFAA
jgi:DNA-binding response OmpR family regulator